jgi:hypothetical protein
MIEKQEIEAWAHQSVLSRLKSYLLHLYLCISLLVAICIRFVCTIVFLLGNKLIF